MPPRFDMPAVFGPSVMPERSPIAAAEAVVTVSRMDYDSLEYLGGRGYHEVVVSVAAVHQSAEGTLRAGFAPVMWVSEVGALISGREAMGFAKLPGEIAPIEHLPGARAFRCSEYGQVLIEGRVDALQPLSDEALARVRTKAQCVQTFGWKLITGPDGQPDVDCPLVNVMRWDYRRAWSGTGEVRFHRPDRRAAPLSSHVLAVLAQLPVKAWRRAFVGEGPALIDRTATRRLAAAPA